MKDSQAMNEDGCGVKCLACSNVSITNSVFKNLTSPKGGAIYLKTKHLSITNSSFDSNRAEFGGALYLEETSNTSIMSTNFA